MRIYKVDADHDNFDGCGIDFAACDKKYPGIEHYDMMFHLDGSPVGSHWWPRIMERYNEAPLGDYISKLSSEVVIMRREAIEKLRPILGNFELLPLECDFGDYWAINILDVIDCIDYTHAKCVRFPAKSPEETGRVICFSKYAFLPSKIAGHHIFKIPEIPKSAILVDDAFVNEVNRQQITGFKFELVWESP